MLRGSWKNMLTKELTDEEESISSKERKFLSYIALFLEIVGIIAIAMSAIYLRFFPMETTTFIPSTWIESCFDRSYNKTKGSQEYVWLFYTVALLIPIALITIEEVEKCSFPKTSRSKHLTNGERFIEGFPRFGRLLGMFVLGVFLTSLLIDYMKLIVSRPRPYILSEYKASICTNLSAPFTADTYAVQSFPSHLSAMVAYCSVFSGTYCYMNKLYSRTPSLLVISTQCFLFLAATVCIDRYNNHFSNIEDILFGLVLGIFFAIYISYHVYLILKSNTSLPPEIIKFPALPRINLPPTVEATNSRTLRNALNSPQPESDSGWRSNIY